jgi:23S rRNA (cytidine2498-2'-O)-methyltransferase
VVLDRDLRMAILPPERHICLTREGQESFIAQELALLSKQGQCTELAPGVVELTGYDLPFLSSTPLFFARQLLPHAILVDGGSIKAIATSLATALIEYIGETPPAWALHVFDPPAVESGEEYSRPRLIREELLSILKQKRRSLLKTLIPEVTPQSTLVQALIGPSGLTFLSITPPNIREALGANISAHRAGFVDIRDNKAPPSRAFKKLEEAFVVFNTSPAPGSTCVDLGACPGGWTYVMAHRGLKITAIDRSPLDPSLMANKAVTFIQGDAFTWIPPKPVTWLVCDVITTPDKTLELLDKWLSKHLCSHLCVTVKFKGTPDFQALAAIRALLAEKTEWFGGKQLTNNKNELTVIGKVRRS